MSDEITATVNINGKVTTTTTSGPVMYVEADAATDEVGVPSVWLDKEERAELERLREENAALQPLAALGKAVEAMPEGSRLHHSSTLPDSHGCVPDKERAWYYVNCISWLHGVQYGSTALEALTKAVLP
jgi:hypothetical protein